MKLLLVMDMQNITVGNNHAEMFSYDNNLLNCVNERICEYEPDYVVYIRNLMKRTLINRLAPVQVYDGMEEGELAKGLKKVSAHIFDKYQGDAFSNRQLADFVKQKNPEQIEVIGVDGGGCVADTAIGAAKRGYKVTINKKCVGTMMKKREDKLIRKMEKMGIHFMD